MSDETTMQTDLDLKIDATIRRGGGEWRARFRVMYDATPEGKVTIYGIFPLPDNWERDAKLPSMPSLDEWLSPEALAVIQQATERRHKLRIPHGMARCNCGYLHPKDKLDDLSEESLPARRCGHYDDAEPAEYVIVCPDCGERDSFEESDT
jgi:hypothetical protein